MPRAKHTTSNNDTIHIKLNCWRCTTMQHESKLMKHMWNGCTVNSNESERSSANYNYSEQMPAACKNPAILLWFVSLWRSHGSMVLHHSSSTWKWSTKAAITATTQDDAQRIATNKNELQRIHKDSRRMEFLCCDSWWRHNSSEYFRTFVAPRNYNYILYH